MGWIPSWLQPVSAPAIPGEGDTRQIDSSAAPISSTSQATAQTSLRPEPAQNPSERSLAAPLPQCDEDEMTSAEGPLLAIPATAFTIGFGAGLYQAAKRSSLVFMAENAHRRPDTVQGWYFYNKTKNYKVLLAGINGGFKTGTQIGLWTLAYVGIEYGTTKALSTYSDSRGEGEAITQRYMRPAAGSVAGLSIASVASVLYRLSGPLSRRLLLLGLTSGASIGTLRDVQHVLAEQRATSEETSTS